MKFNNHHMTDMTGKNSTEQSKIQFRNKLFKVDKNMQNLKAENDNYLSDKDARDFSNIIDEFWAIFEDSRIPELEIN